MKEQIKQIEAVRGELAKIEKPSTYIGSAISALNCARDNLTWHVEAEGKTDASGVASLPPKK